MGRLCSRQVDVSLIDTSLTAADITEGLPTSARTPSMAFQSCRSSRHSKIASRSEHAVAPLPRNVTTHAHLGVPTCHESSTSPFSVLGNTVCLHLIMALFYFPELGLGPKTSQQGPEFRGLWGLSLASWPTRNTTNGNDDGQRL